MSYGLTNFAWIWLWLDKDGHTLEWSLLILSGWLSTALLSQNFGSGFPEISISRSTEWLKRFFPKNKFTVLFIA